MHRTEKAMCRFMFILLKFILFFQISFTATSKCREENCRKIEQLKSLLRQENFPPNSSQVCNYIQDDLYIWRWLELARFDLTLAHNLFTEHLKWRQEERMDTIHLEDWSQFQEDYPQYLDTMDKYGRPVAELWLSDWDFRRAFVSGQSRQLERWMVYLMEMGQRNLYKIRRDSGLKNVTGILELVDLEGFNAVKHACSICTQFMINYQRLSKEQYPGIWAKNYMLNAGPLYRSILVMTSKAVKYGSNDVLKIYGTQSEWLPVISSEVSSDQRSLRFGGTFKRS